MLNDPYNLKMAVKKSNCIICLILNYYFKFCGHCIMQTLLFLKHRLIDHCSLNLIKTNSFLAGMKTTHAGNLTYIIESSLFCALFISTHVNKIDNQHTQSWTVVHIIYSDHSFPYMFRVCSSTHYITTERNKKNYEI